MDIDAHKLQFIISASKLQLAIRLLQEYETALRREREPMGSVKMRRLAIAKSHLNHVRKGLISLPKHQPIGLKREDD